MLYIQYIHINKRLTKWIWFSMSKIVWDVNVGTCLSNRFVQPQHLARGRILWSPGPSWTSNFFHLDRPHHPVSTRLSTGNTDLDWLCSFWKVVDGGYLFHHWHQIYVQSCWVFPWSTMCVCVYHFSPRGRPGWLNYRWTFISLFSTDYSSSIW